MCIWMSYDEENDINITVVKIMISNMSIQCWLKHIYMNNLFYNYKYSTICGEAIRIKGQSNPFIRFPFKHTYTEMEKLSKLLLADTIYSTLFAPDKSL